jgi:hypothetical protein
MSTQRTKKGKWNTLIILEWILGKYGGRMLTGFIWLQKGAVVGSCKNSTELSDSIKGGEFHD